MDVEIRIDHNGKSYKGTVAKINSTSLGWEDHGILTAMLHLTWEGAGIGTGGYCLDSYVKDAPRRGTAYGLDHIMRIMETVGVDKWEDLKGKDLIVLFDAPPDQGTWGMTSVGIAGLLNGKILIYKEHVESFKESEAAKIEV